MGSRGVDNTCKRSLTMKILAKRPRDKEVSEPFWWVGKIVQCWSCKSWLKSEKTDRLLKEESRYHNKDLMDTISWSTECPVCKTKVVVHGIGL